MELHRTLKLEEFEDLCNGKALIKVLLVSEHRWYDRHLYVFYLDGHYLGCYREEANHADGEHVDDNPIELFSVEPYEYKEIRYRPLT